MTRRGVTLIELVITIAILGIIASVTVLAVRRFDPPRADDPQQIVKDSLRHVLSTGQPSYVRVVINGVMANAFLRPDGSVLADSAFAIDRFTGVPTNVR